MFSFSRLGLSSGCFLELMLSKVTHSFPDTVFKVIHCRGRRAAAKPSSAAAAAVNNFAESAAELVKN
jgi:hypothetical protein